MAYVSETSSTSCFWSVFGFRGAGVRVRSRQGWVWHVPRIGPPRKTSKQTGDDTVDGNCYFDAKKRPETNQFGLLYDGPLSLSMANRGLVRAPFPGCTQPDAPGFPTGKSNRRSLFPSSKFSSDRRSHDRDDPFYTCIKAHDAIAGEKEKRRGPFFLPGARQGKLLANNKA